MLMLRKKQNQNSDIGHDQTDALIAELEKKIKKEYRQAAKEIDEKSQQFLEDFKRKNIAKYNDYKAGKISYDEYKRWQVNQMLVSERWIAMRDTLAEDLTLTSEKAASIAYGYTPEAYAINMNYQTYMIEHETGLNTGFTLYDRQTVEGLIRDGDIELLPPPKEGTIAYQRAHNKATRWNRQHLTSAMTQGILQGESIPKIAKRLASVSDMDKNASIRNARTAMTYAQNSGRQAGMERAQAMGIDLQKQWMATLDGRTRHEHRVLNNQRVPLDEPFVVDGYEINFPGDPTAKAFLVYNCRCTMVSAIKGFSKALGDAEIARNPKVKEETYEEWVTEGKRHKKEEYNANTYTHKTFGKGTIIGSDDTFTTIRFDDGVERKFMTSFLDKFRAEEKPTSIRENKQNKEKTIHDVKWGKNDFVRFGSIPENEMSLNYLKLTGEQRDDISNFTDDGRLTPLEAVRRLKKLGLSGWDKINEDDIFEKGVSVFNTSTGIPKIENLKQAQSMAVRLDKDLYKVTGKEIGKGEDGEPILQDTKSEKLSFNKKEMIDDLVETLKKNFEMSEGDIDYDKSDQIFKFGDEVIYKGITFKKAKHKKWGEF